MRATESGLTLAGPYFAYYHMVRPHLSLGKDAPGSGDERTRDMDRLVSSAARPLRLDDAPNRLAVALGLG